MTETLTPEELAAFYRRASMGRPDEVRVVNVARVPTIEGEALVIVYDADGYMEQITQRLLVMLPGENGGSDAIVGEVRPVNLELDRADRAKRAAEVERTACKHAAAGHAAIETEGSRCTSCGEFTGEELPAGYECGGCGTAYTVGEGDSRNCPECHKFGAKVAAEVCPSCEAPDSIEPASVMVCAGCHAEIEAVTS